VTVEVTPHHLFFDLSSLFDSASAEEKNSKSSSEVRLGRTKEDDQVSIINRRKIFQVNPPIRQSPETRQYLLRALKQGDIDFIATDHAPHSPAEKAQGMSGLTHLDTFGPFVTWLMQAHQFTPQEIARVGAYNPAQFFNQFSNYQYGKIAKGFVGSLTIIDMHRPITITKALLKTKAQWSPFEGVTFPGSVAYTIVKGKVYKNL
jgi:dihydroorotase